jgi:predicted helicase
LAEKERQMALLRVVFSTAYQSLVTLRQAQPLGLADIVDAQHGIETPSASFARALGVGWHED